MATGAVVIRWGAVVPGREAKALEVFGKSIERFEQLAKQGRIHSHKEYLALTGTMGGFTVVDGDLEELQKIIVEPETISLNAQAEAIVQDFEQQLYAGGTDQAVQEMMGSYMTATSELGYL
jgi:hypothetical protein